MKKAIIIFSVLLLTAGAVWLLNSMSSGNTGLSDIESSGNVSVEKLMASCDSLESRLQNKSEFEKLRAQINMFHSQGLITQVDKQNLEAILYSAYAGSLNLSFKNWKRQCAKNSVTNLYSDIKQLSKHNSTCRGKLRGSYSEINGYYRIQRVTNNISKLIQKEYNQNTLSANEIDLKGLPSYFKSCSNITADINSAKNKLASYKTFVFQYNNHKKAHISRPDSWTLYDLKKDYNEARNQGFKYYENSLDNEGFSSN